MCSRYYLSLEDLAAIPARFAVPAPSIPLKTESDYRAGSAVPVIALDKRGERGLQLLRWGLVPEFAKDMREGARGANARAEGIENKPSFRAAVRERRCLLPATGYFEWQDAGTRQRKQPWRFTVGDGSTPELFAFAGVWERWHDAGANRWIATCAVITCEPNAYCGAISERMPVILPPGEEATWIDTATPLKQALDLLMPYRAGPMTAKQWDFKNEGN